MSEPEFEIPDFFDPADWENPLESKEKDYLQKPVGEWILAQAELGHLVVPEVARVMPIGETGHSVMWVERTIRDGSRYSRRYHLVCDCIEDALPEDIANPSFKCPAIDPFIKWGALETRHEKGLDVILDLYKKIPDALPVTEDRNAKPGDDVLGTLIKELLRETTLHPERWIANREGGSHNITGISYIFGQDKRKTSEVLEEMQSQQIIEIEDGETVRLRAA